MPIVFFGEDREDVRHRRRDVPRLALAALRMLRAAGPRELLAMLGLEAFSALLLTASVLLGREVLAAVLDAEQDGSGWDGVLPAVAGLAAVSILMATTTALARQVTEMLGELVGRHANGRILDVTCSVELAAFDDAEFYDLVTRAQRGAFQADTIVRALFALARAAAGVVAGLVALAVIQPLLLPVAALAAAPSVLLARRQAASRYGFAYKMTAADRERQYVGGLLTDRSGAQEIRAMELAGFLRGRYEGLYDRRMTELRALMRTQVRWAVAAALASSAIIGATLTVLVALTLSGQLSVPEAAAAGGAMVLLGERLSAGSFGSQMLLESALFLDDFLSFVARTPSAPPVAPQVAPRDPGAPPVVAEAVSFSYAGSPGPVLRDVSVRVEPGQVVALVGANGSGKTTLAKLLAGLYVPERGRVLLYGADTARADRHALRRDVAVVFQDFVRYSLPVRDNIAIRRHERFGDGAGVVDAARRAGVDADLERLPDGYASMLGPAFAGGVDLSVGQWQKIAIARLFFRDAPFVILDEPTAALDARAEHDLFARIRELLEGRAVLLISHRFSTVREADRIYVLADGTVIEAGNHDELMALGGTYAEMFTLQAAAYAPS